jgi:hypothetical protein
MVTTDSRMPTTPTNDPDAAGIGSGGMFGRDFDFSHDVKYPRISFDDVQARIHAREMPSTPLRTTSTMSPKAPTLAMNSPISARCW